MTLFVVVSDSTNAHIYGPFTTLDLAADFVNDHVNDFAGRHVNVTQNIINPKG